MSLLTDILAALSGAPVVRHGDWAVTADALAAQPPQGDFERYGARTIVTSGRVRALTPARVVGYMSQADQGDPAAWCELLQEVEDRSAHIVSVLSTRKRAVAGLSWSIKPSDPDDAVARGYAEAAEAALKRTKQLQPALVDLLDAVHKGFAASEIVWRYRASTGRTEPAELLWRPQSWLQPDRDDPHVWRLRDQANLMDGVPLIANKWIVHTSRAKSGFPIQAGLGRVLVWWYLFSAYAIQDWVAYGEKFGSPLRIGKYPSTASPSDITALEDAVERLGVAASAVMPEDMDVDVVGDSAPTRGPDVYERLIDRANREISKAVLGQTLTTEEGQNGTQALGMVHNSVRADLRDSDADELAYTLTEQLVRPFILLNWGPEALERCPRLVFETQPPQDRSIEADVQTKRGAVFKLASELGVPVPLSQVREELGIQEPAAGEALLRGAAAAADPSAAPVASGSPSLQLTSTDIAAIVTVNEARASQGLPPLTNADGLLTVTQYQAKYASTLATAASAAAGTTPGAVAASMASQCTCGRCAGAPILGSVRGGVRAAAVGQVTVSPTVQLDEVLKEYQRQVDRAWRELVGQLRRELGDVADAADMSARLPGAIAALNLGAYADPLAEAMLSARGLGLLQARARDSREVEALPQGSPFDVERWAAALDVEPAVWRAAVAEAETRADQAIRYALLASAQDLVAELEAEADEPAPARADGWAERQAELPARSGAVVEGAAVGAWGEGRWEGVGPDKSRVFLRYNTMEDDKVRPAHRAMQGRVYQADHPIWRVWRPPNGFGCRCWLTAHTGAEVEAAGWDVLDSYPAVPEGEKGAGQPAVPDPGFTSSLRVPEHDLSAFPTPWREAVDAQIEKHRQRQERRREEGKTP